MSDPSKDFEDRNLAENEEAIEKTLTYLKYHDPSNANREYAIGLLKRMQTTAEVIAIEDATTASKLPTDGRQNNHE